MSAERIAGLARDLLRKGGTLESAAGTDAFDGAALEAAIRKRLDTGAGEDAVNASEASALAARITGDAIGAIHRLETVEPADLSDRELASLEAIVLLTGRPPLRYPGGALEMPEELAENEVWRVLIGLARRDIERGSASVGRIALEPSSAPVEPVGTGWRLGANLVVTNRHVARFLAADPSIPPETWTLAGGVTAAIDFAAVHQTPGPRRFVVSRIAWCAGLDGPDLAILELGVNGGSVFPAALPLDWDAESLGNTIDEEGVEVFRGSQVYVVGHPYRTEASDAVASVYGAADGKKRCSPGYVTRLRPARSIFDHDCSTLEGNSGSCVFSVDFHRVVGVHFSGVGTDADGVGRSNVAFALAFLAGSQAGAILKAGVV